MSPLAFDVTNISYRGQAGLVKRRGHNSKESKTTWEQLLKENNAINSQIPKLYCSISFSCVLGDSPSDYPWYV